MNNKYVTELVKQLINIPSLSEKEMKLAEFCFEWLRQQGLEPERVKVDENGFNIMVVVGQPKVYLSAHMDTVGPWLGFRQEKEVIYGRGACDVKGGMAAMMMAVYQAKQTDWKDFGLILTVGEETEFRGARKMVKDRKLPFVVVAEPTRMKPVNGHFGLIEMEMETKGKKAHSSQPELGENAIEKLIDNLNEARKIEMKGQSSMNIGVIEGGEAVNIVPDRAGAKISFRVDPKDETDFAGRVKEARVSLEMKPVYCPLPQALGWLGKPETVKYGTELSYYQKGVVIGPGEIRWAHTDQEKIGVRELEEAVEIYRKIIESVLK